MTDETKDAGNALTPAPVSKINFDSNFDTMLQLAQLMAKSRAVLPKHFHNSPGECLAIVMQARDWNMNPYAVGAQTVLMETKRGPKLMYMGQLVNSVINTSPVIEERLRFTFEGDGKGRKCIATGRVRGEKESRTVQVVPPSGSQPCNSPLWNGSPDDVDQQLTYKAARVWCRRHTPEILMGVYTPEDDWSEVEGSEAQQAVNARIAALEHTPAVPMEVVSADSEGAILQPIKAPVKEDEFTAGSKPAISIEPNAPSNLRPLPPEDFDCGAGRHDWADMTKPNGETVTLCAACGEGLDRANLPEMNY